MNPWPQASALRTQPLGDEGDEGVTLIDPRRVEPPRLDADTGVPKPAAVGFRFIPQRIVLPALHGRHSPRARLDPRTARCQGNAPDR